ncbi:uncharacterized protein LOC143147681 [Ptiloglossa arizonensis]|uniref:uncharacterized protein LOC143147681 n=1 Tax=Ptiloglossa arizonensis TaxID=3350558 RepID=UPI003F9EC541
MLPPPPPPPACHERVERTTFTHFYSRTSDYTLDNAHKILQDRFKLYIPSSTPEPIPMEIPETDRAGNTLPTLGTGTVDRLERSKDVFNKFSIPLVAKLDGINSLHKFSGAYVFRGFAVYYGLPSVRKLRYAFFVET